MTLQPPWLLSVIAAGAYLLGGISPGWAIVRAATGKDIRAEGSGATGATNASRLLGREGYAIVLILDALKGCIAILAARWLDPADPWAAVAAPAVVAGHIWPPWLRFKGGRGAAPLLGVCLGMHWALAPLAWVPGLAVGLVTRRGFAARATATVASLPVAWWLLPELPSRLSFSAAWLLVLLAHRSHFVQPRKSA